MQIIVDGLLTNYELKGSGQLVVLLHGWGDNLKGLDTVQASLQDSYQTLALDMPGFGKSQAPIAAWGLDEYATFIGHMLNKLNLGDPYAMIGHSNGGAVTVNATGTGRINPAKIVLIGSSGIRNRLTLRRAAFLGLAKMAKIVAIIIPRKQREALRQKSYSAIGSDFLVMPELAETFKKTVRQDAQEDAAAIKVPALLLFARDDNAVPFSDGERFHQLIKGSVLHPLDTGGHYMQKTQSEIVNKAIKEFLA
ncbi:MAG: alpha/beta hydrolase [Patescibacteria group bacterium]|nr:alpha/beta hydrolase [Patescibacteria group bacterium]